MKRFYNVIIACALALAYSISAHAEMEINGIIYDRYSTPDGDVFARALKCKKAQEVVKIPSKIRYEGEALEVYAIGQQAFKNNETLREITLPATIHLIDWEAFRGCSNLENVNILTTSELILDESAFRGTAIREISLPDRTSVWEYIFADCSLLENVEFKGIITAHPAKGFVVNYGGEDMFKNCSSLRMIELPCEQTVIDQTFNGCSRLSIIALLNDLELRIGNNKPDYSASFPYDPEEGNCAPCEPIYAFDGCSSLKELYLNVTLTYEGMPCIENKCYRITQGEYAPFDYYGTEVDVWKVIKEEMPLYGITTENVILFIPKGLRKEYENWVNYYGYTFKDIKEVDYDVPGWSIKKLQGDINYDMTVNTSDLTSAISATQGGFEIHNLDKIDFNRNDALDQDDISTLIDRILNPEYSIE